MAYVGDATTSSGLSVEIKTFYDNVLLERALPNLVHTQWAQVRPIPRNTGRSIEFRRFNSLPEATAALTEGTPSNQQNMVVSNVVASLTQYGSFVQFSDLVEETTLDPYLTETAQVLGEQAGSTIDIIVRNILVSSTNVRFVGGVGSRGAVTASSILNASEIRRAGRTLKRANARGIPELGGKFAFALHPDCMMDLLGDSTITTSFERGAPRDVDEQAEFLGYIGSWMGFAFFETTNAKIFSSLGASGADVYASLAIGRDAYGVSELGPDGLQVYYQPRGSGGATNDALFQVGSLGNDKPAQVKLRVIKGKAYGRKAMVTHCKQAA